MDGRQEGQQFTWIEESNSQVPPTVRKRRRPKRIEYVGWGSRQLIEFLESIGTRTDEALAQSDVASIINQYIVDNNLINPAKKKRVLCDTRLQALFGRKSIGRNMVHELLESHIAANQCDSDSDSGYSSDDKELKKNTEHKPKNNSASDGNPRKRKKACEAPEKCLAAITPENIKLVFLKRSLVEELLKDPTTFEFKVLGSYVRVKTDPYDYLQKNSHVLQIVTGVKKDDTDGENVRLEIADMGKRIKISELTEQSFSEEECLDLQRRIKESLIKQPTVAELQEKVQILHEDITKHWLEKEISRLTGLIDRANEKGWRREFFEYREKRKLLETPAEKSRLLLEVPQVIAEELKVDAAQAGTEHCTVEGRTDPPGQKIDRVIEHCQVEESANQPSLIDWVISNDPPAGVATTSGGADSKAQDFELVKLDGESSFRFQPSRVEVECAVEQSRTEVVANGHLHSETKEMNPAAGSATWQAKVMNPMAGLSFRQTGATNPVLGSSLKQAEMVNPVTGSSVRQAETMNPVAGSSVRQAEALDSVPSWSLKQAKATNPVVSPSVTQFEAMNPEASSSFRQAEAVNPVAGSSVRRAEPMSSVAGSSVRQAEAINHVASWSFKQAKVMNPVVSPSVKQSEAMNPVASSSSKEAKVMNPMVGLSVRQPEAMNPVASLSFRQAGATNPVASSSVRQAEAMNSVSIWSLKQAKVTNPVVSPSAKQSEVINLSDDEEDNAPPVRQQQIRSSVLDEAIWHYLDPQNEVQGPFSLMNLKRWSNLGYFFPGFRVWKSGQHQNQCVLLSEVLQQVFPQ